MIYCQETKQIHTLPEASVFSRLADRKSMADSSEDSFSEEFVFYRDREDWKDIAPVPQDEGPHPIVRIAYSDKCKSNVVFDHEHGEMNVWKSKCRISSNQAKSVEFSVTYLSFITSLISYKVYWWNISIQTCCPWVRHVSWRRCGICTSKYPEQNKKVLWETARGVPPAA